MIDIETKNERSRNYLRAAYFRSPEWIPCAVGIMPATWKRHREELEDVLLRHPGLFPEFERGRTDFDAVGDQRYAGGRFTDNWGCVWDNIAEGLDGVVVRSPLEDWERFPDWHPPDPITEGEGWGAPPDWDRLRRQCEDAKRAGLIAAGHLPHGFMYMRLYYLRRFENLMLDFGSDEPRLEDLIDVVLQYNLAAIGKTIECGVEMIHFGDDLGIQKSLPISPAKWRRYLLPCYERMLGLCTERGVEVYFHSDGHMTEIIPDLIGAGVTILNPQVGANGLDGLARVAKGKVCVNLDLDRQLFPFAGPEQIADHIRGAVAGLDSPAGGLMLYAECEPDVPLANIRAICKTLEEVGGPC
ncbi:MAG: hypothetical protein KAX19_12355 [Candidatus Brocadiae bacterium]|nr:hypothetical protein [Candidatus Brocadiia bacterium]